MIELRWVWHNFSDGAPLEGSICINTDGRLYQKLQYRREIFYIDASGAFRPSGQYSEWMDVPHEHV